MIAEQDLALGAQGREFLDNAERLLGLLQKIVAALIPCHGFTPVLNLNRLSIQSTLFLAIRELKRILLF